MELPALQERTLGEESDIRVRYFVSPVDKSGRDILVIRYSGVYGYGSAGNPDAHHMYAMAMAGVAAFEPSAVIHDLTELQYEWGDMLELVFNVPAELVDMPFAIVTGSNCDEAVRTLLFGGDGSVEPPEVVGLVHGDLPAAWAQVARQL
jgi:hypothetical protein